MPTHRSYRGAPARCTIKGVKRPTDLDDRPPRTPGLGDRAVVRATSAVLGIAIGRAEHVADDVPRRASMREFAMAAGLAARSLEATIASLPRPEAELFEPERPILAELVERVQQRAAAGEAVDAALEAEVRETVTDLVRDAHDRLTHALAAGRASAGGAENRRARGGDVVLVADHVTPSLVAELPPGVVGIMAGDETPEREGGAGARPVPRAPGFFTSHAAILARGRGLPLVFAPALVIHAILEGEIVALDATAREAWVWFAPGAETVARLREKRKALERAHAHAAEASARSRPAVPVRVNVGSICDIVPEGADGIGLVRTELVFAAWDRAPSEEEQHAALASIVRRARGALVCVRLFDAGGDKPLRWVPPPAHDRAARGMALLFHHAELLDAQLRAIGRARAAGDLRALIPVVRHADDVAAVRARSSGGVPIGAMIETLEAAAAIDAIASVADFLCIGTNDLEAAVAGVGRTGGLVHALADALDGRVAAIVATVAERAHARGRTVTVCGEAASDPVAARRLVALGVDALSVAPSHLAAVRLALAVTPREERPS